MTAGWAVKSLSKNVQGKVHNYIEDLCADRTYIKGELKSRGEIVKTNDETL